MAGSVAGQLPVLEIALADLENLQLEPPRIEHKRKQRDAAEDEPRRQRGALKENAAAAVSWLARTGPPEHRRPHPHARRLPTT